MFHFFVSICCFLLGWWCTAGLSELASYKTAADAAANYAALRLKVNVCKITTRKEAKISGTEGEGLTCRKTRRKGHLLKAVVINRAHKLAVRKV